MEDAFDYVNDLEVSIDYISELKLCNIPDNVRNNQISKVCRVEWRCQKTLTWKRNIIKMAQSMIRVENWLTKPNDFSILVHLNLDVAEIWCDVSTLVRISHTKQLFARAYQQQWSSEIFKVHKRFFRQGIPQSQLIDFLYFLYII